MREKTLFSRIRLWCVACGICLLTPLSAFSQNQKITVDIQGLPLEKAMEIIGKQSSMEIAYSKEFVDPTREVNLKAKGQTLERALQELLKGTDVGFRFLNNCILLYNKSKQIVQSPENRRMVEITGKIVDKQTREPIVGATIHVVGSPSGTISDIDGNYSLKVTEGSTISYSFIGYAEEKHVIHHSGVINISLMENAIKLDDVVVVGYGIQKKMNLTGSVSMVKGDELDSRPVPSVAAGLQGALPGVTITSTSGQPGNPGVSINVRGVSTINSSTGPLILIDGISGGDINLLNPDDIESISVLKDAASSAIYGARAANGVILVTTKTGSKKEKTSLNYSGYFGIQIPTDLPEIVNGRDYMTLANEAYAAAGIARPFNDDSFMRYDSKNFPNEYSNTDWIDASLKNSTTQQSHSISINGGSDKTSWYMSYGLLDQKGIVVGDNYASRRHNVRMRLNTTVFDRIKLDGNIGFIDFYRKDPGNSGTSGVFRLAQRISPLLPVMWQQPTTDGGFEDTSYWAFGSVVNPVRAALESGNDERKSKTFTGNFNATVDIVKGLTANIQYAYNFWTRDTKAWHPTQPRFYADGTPHPNNEAARNSISETRESTTTQTLNGTLNYEMKIKKHSIKLLAGYSQEWAFMNTVNAARKNILLEGIEQINAGTEDITNSGTASHWALMSWFGRVNYDFAEKYLFEANVRYDGTSRFSAHDNNRWGIFPSFSAGWKFSEESFMDFSKPYLTMGKLRASWGELGNQTIGSEYYPYLVEIERLEKAYPIGGGYNVGFKQNKLANEMIQWETLRMINVGIDLAAFNNRLDVSFDWFKKKNINALLKPIYPTIVGITTTANLPFENMGEIENTGWELSIGWRDNIGKVRYGFTANLSDARNKITKLGKSAPSLGNSLRREGDPINAYYGYATDGLLQISDFETYDETTGKYKGLKVPTLSAYSGIVQPGDVKYIDISGPDGIPDGNIDDNDKRVFGDPYPRYSYSFKGFVEWKNFDFQFYLQGVGKVNGYLTEEARHCFINDYSIPKTAHLDRWTPNNPGASYPRMFYNPAHNTLFSDYWIEDASYLRLKNVQLGYTLPVELTQRVNISKVKFYISADNLLTFTNYFGGFDPEVRETAGDAYPQMRTIAFGVQIGF